MNGFEVLKELRKHSDIPVIILSARDTEDDKLEGLSLMADDYMTKPFSIKELIARIKVNLARCEKSQKPDTTLCAGGISVDTNTLVVTKDKKEIAVSKKEAQILLLLFKTAAKYSRARTFWKRCGDITDILATRTQSMLQSGAFAQKSKTHRPNRR